MNYDTLFQDRNEVFRTGQNEDVGLLEIAVLWDAFVRFAGYRRQ